MVSMVDQSGLEGRSGDAVRRRGSWDTLVRLVGLLRNHRKRNGRQYDRSSRRSYGHRFLRMARDGLSRLSLTLVRCHDERVTSRFSPTFVDDGLLSTVGGYSKKKPASWEKIEVGIRRSW